MYVWKTPGKTIRNGVMIMLTINVINALRHKKCTSAWSRGVNQYAIELLQDLEDENEDIFANPMLKKQLLNGAGSWREYSEGGCSLIYDGDIAKRLCTPSELKRTDGGRLMPNSRENWIDVQARALFQAYNRIVSLIVMSEKEN